MSNYSFLQECGIDVPRSSFMSLTEANQVQVTEDILSGMMKFITDKYNSMDFGEIEKSAGDYMRFKYHQMILENLRTLDNVYASCTDPAAKKYREVIDDCQSIDAFLTRNRGTISELYKLGDGMTQLLYVSMVSAILYCTGALVSNTIRFVTTDKNADCEVLFDEIPGSIRNIHIKNASAAAKSLDSISKYLQTVYNERTGKSVKVESALGVIAISATALYLLPKVIVLIREIISSIYCSRVRISDMLGLQANLIRTNIESLEAGRGSKKVIARQKKIADSLEKWKARVALKSDTAELLKKNQMRKENEALHLDSNSPLISDDDSMSGILL